MIPYPYTEATIENWDVTNEIPSVVIKPTNEDTPTINSYTNGVGQAIPNSPPNQSVLVVGENERVFTFSIGQASSIDLFYR